MATSEGIIHRMTGHNGKIYLYEDRVVIERNYVFSGVDNKSIPLSSIVSVQLQKAGLFKGYIQFGVLGGVESNNRVTTSYYDENTITFKKQKNDIAISIKNYIEKAISQRSKLSSVKTISAADEILKFKQLADSGVITQEEFEAKKKQLLGM
ncbi:MAG: SHOCT domain-containing protein [Oscillospiraceae bacterium]|nr:SHOCT domain-containing protein [Oscillospiraceae bacterium]